MEMCVKKTVYILGAGFSAVAGIPTMNRFIEVAKDIALSTDDKELSDLINRIRDMSYIKNYMNSDLFNLEEIFSILEMEDWLKGTNNADAMSHMIKTVIEKSTPDYLVTEDQKPGNWQDHIGGAGIYKKIFNCVMYLLDIKFKNIEKNFGKQWKRLYLQWQLTDRKVRNDIISLNYDCLLENSLKTFNQKSKIPLKFNTNETAGLFKLHGCISDGSLIPPTWAKTKNEELVNTWKSAYKVLSEANVIEILGYSLPPSDAYFQYFLKTAILNNENLKKINVSCLDSTGIVKRNYENLFCYRNFEFYNENLKNLIFSKKIKRDNEGWFYSE